jgi:hypothetical protein
MTVRSHVDRSDRPPRPRRIPTPLAIRAFRAFWRLTVITIATVTVLTATSGTAFAGTPTPVDSIGTVVSNLRLWLLGILAAVATLYLTIGGLRYMTANGDPGEIEKAKQSFKSAALGYGLALLAPLLVTIVTSWVTT